MTRPRLLRPERSGIARSIEDYLQACRARGVKASTIRDAYGFPLRSILRPWCEEEGIDDPEQLDQRALERFASWLRDRPGRPLSENSVWTYLKATNQFLAWATDDPAKVKLRKPPARRVEVLERDEIKELERAAIAERDRVIIRLLADTGIRPGELVSLHGGDLVKEGRRCYIVVRGKTGEREVGVQPELWRRLRQLAHDDDDPVFIGLRANWRTGQRDPLKEGGVLQMVRDLSYDIGLRKKVTPYTFRHSACRWMLLKGMSTVEVAQILGHGSEKMIAEHYHNIGKTDAHDRLMALLRSED